MKSITINVASRGLFILTIVGIFTLSATISGLVLRNFTHDLSMLAYLGTFACIFILLFRKTRKIHKGQVSLTITESGLAISWVKQFLFHEKQDVALPWEGIKDYMLQPDQYFDIFRIRMHDKRKFQFNLTDYNDEFSFFYREFEESIASKRKNGTVNIERAKTIFESSTGLILAIIFGIIVLGSIGMVIGLIIKSKTTPSYGRLFYLFGSLSLCIFFILQVIRARKNSKNKSV